MVASVERWPDDDAALFRGLVVGNDREVSDDLVATFRTRFDRIGDYQALVGKQIGDAEVSVCRGAEWIIDGFGLF